MAFMAAGLLQYYSKGCISRGYSMAFMAAGLLQYYSKGCISRGYSMASIVCWFTTVL